MVTFTAVVGGAGLRGVGQTPGELVMARLATQEEAPSPRGHLNHPVLQAGPSGEDSGPS